MCPVSVPAKESSTLVKNNLIGFTEQHDLVGDAARRRMLSYQFSHTTFKIDKKISMGLSPFMLKLYMLAYSSPPPYLWLHVSWEVHLSKETSLSMALLWLEWVGDPGTPRMISFALLSRKGTLQTLTTTVNCLNRYDVNPHQNCSLVLSPFLNKRETRSLIFMEFIAPMSVRHQSMYLGTSSLGKQGDSEHLQDALSLLLSARVQCPWSAIYIPNRGCPGLVNRNGRQKGKSDLSPFSEACITGTGMRPLPLWGLNNDAGVLKLVAKSNPHLKRKCRPLLEQVSSVASVLLNTALFWWKEFASVVKNKAPESEILLMRVRCYILSIPKL